MNAKKFWVVVACVCLGLGLDVGASDISPGLSIGTGSGQIQDGQRLTSAKLLQLVSDAAIQTTFYTGKTSQTNLAGGDVLLVVSAATGTFHKLTGNAALLQNVSLISGQSVYTSLSGYESFLLYDPTNGVLGQITLSNLMASGAVSVPVSNLVFATTNGNLLPLWSGDFTAGQTNNQPFSLWWGTNGAPYAQSLSNLVVAIVPDLGTNYLPGYTFNNLWNPATFIQPATNASTNVWGYTNVFAITNLTEPSTNIPTLGGTNTVPIYVQGQGTNTTVTLEALGQYLQSAQTARLLAVGYTNYTNFSATIPYDDTIPQITEGAELFSTNYTPSGASNQLTVDVSIPAEVPSSGGIVALFLNGQTNAVAAQFTADTGSVGEQPFLLHYVLPAGATTNLTFAVRVGQCSAGSGFQVNGSGSARKLGGVESAWFTIRENSQ